MVAALGSIDLGRGPAGSRLALFGGPPRRGDLGLDYWYAAAERLLAPLLLAGSLVSGSMAEVVRWLDDEAVNEPLLALELANEHDAARVARSCIGLEERQRSSVYATAQTVVAGYADPEVAASERASARVGASWLVERPGRTLYCCAPARDQARLSPIFVALVSGVIDAAFERSSRLGRPLDKPLLVVLDEAANIAPLGRLDQCPDRRWPRCVVRHGVAGPRPGRGALTERGGPPSSTTTAQRSSAQGSRTPARSSC